ncbi:MAG: PilZ domain-containing protein [Gammaproteobacteria bacterium]|jgi:DNA-binding NarL/FixJ family response regulator
MTKSPLCIAGGTAEDRRALGLSLAAAGFGVVGSFADAASCADAAGGFDEPDLVLLLTDAEGASGESDVLVLKRMYPEARVVMMGGGATRAEFAGYIDAGLDGYVPSTLDGHALFQSLKVILLGEQIYIAGSRKAAAEATKADRRTSARRRTLRKASILVDGRAELLDGMVLDMSDTGAKIRPGNMERLPAQFELRCGYGRTYRCEVVRRSGFYLGVQFVDAGGAPGVAQG